MREGAGEAAGAASPVCRATYGSFSCQAPRPCDAAYSRLASGTIVRPATSTFGMAVPASVQLVVPATSRETPKSDDAYRSPFESATRSVTGRSPQSLLRSTQVALFVAGLNVTSNTCPGVAGVFASNPLYETHAWFPFAGST